MDEFINQAVKALIANWPMVAALGWLGWKGFPWALRVHGHEAFSSEKGQVAMKENMTNFFNNGGGEKVRDIIRTENAMQSALHKDEIRSAIKEHEEVERARFNERLDEFRQEITGEFDLPRQPPPRRAARRRSR
jgi:hypothetical protein